MTALDWPTTADDITPEWLTAALADRHPGIEDQSGRGAREG